MRHYKDKHPDKDLPENLAVGNSSGFGDTNASFNEVIRNGELNTQQDGNDNEVINSCANMLCHWFE